MEPIATLQWATGIFIAMTLAIFGHIYAQLARLNDTAGPARLEQLVEMRSDIARLRTAMETEWHHRSELKAIIMSQMVTRDDLNREVDRMLTEIERRAVQHRTDDSKNS